LVKIPIHGWGVEFFYFSYEISNGFVWRVVHSSWICKGDLNKRYDGNRNPILSFLFSIKAKRRHVFNMSKCWNVLALKRLWSFICWEKKSLHALIEGWLNHFDLLHLHLVFKKEDFGEQFPFFFFLFNGWKFISNVYSYCSLKNNVLWIIFRPFRTETASGPQG